MTMATTSTSSTSSAAPASGSLNHQSSTAINYPAQGTNQPSKQNQPTTNDNSFSDDEEDISLDQKKTIELFESLQNFDLEQLFDKDIATVLPYLTKLLLSKTFVKKQLLLKLLYYNKKMNQVLQYMTVREIEPSEISDLPPESSFESCDCRDKIRLVAAEYINIHGRARQSNISTNQNIKLLHSNLFDNPIYIDDVSYCLCTLLLNSTVNNSIMNIFDMSEALLHIKYGTTFIIRLITNMPSFCDELCKSLIDHGERQDEGSNFNEISENRAKSLRLICKMNPSIAFSARSSTLQTKKMPSLTITITLVHLSSNFEDYNNLVKQFNSESSENQMDINRSEDIKKARDKLEKTYDNAIAFITGILLGYDDGIRQWFAQYTKSAQQKRIDQSHFTILSKFRSQLLEYMNVLFSSLIDDYDHDIDSSVNDTMSSDKVNNLCQKDLNRTLIRATATLRLFCALRGIGSLKLNQEESVLLLRLVTCKPQLSQTSVNFATTGVCTILVCSALINNTKEEKRAADWLKWLIKESNYNDNRFSSHGKCSISELLLLIATHFQNNQNNQIAELICATLDMKLQIKASVSKCKSLFVQEVFNDQMVAEHAVKVPVTKGLNNNISEFLPVHCIHQLLESRSFSKHQIPIKQWIYKQICESKKPIHNILPKLIEAYVNSVIISTSVHGHCGTNEPLDEEDILRVFKTQLYSVEDDKNTETKQNPIIDLKGSTPKKKTKKEKNIPEAMNICDDKENRDTSSSNLDQSKDFEPTIVDVETAQVLLLYYLLLYEDIRLKKNADLSSEQKSKLIKYNPDFMMDIPIFYLLQLVRDNQNSFGVILPGLLKLVTSQYPQLCSIQHWLNIEHYEPYKCSNVTNNIHNGMVSRLFEKSNTTILSENKTVLKPDKENLMNQLVEGFSIVDKDPTLVTKTLSTLLSLRREEIWPYVQPFIVNLLRVVNLEQMDNIKYKKLIQITTKVWWKFNTVFPRKLWVMTVNTLKRPQNLRMGQKIKPVEYSWDEIALDPLIVLRCDPRVFRSVDTLNIVLHILTAFLAASRRCLYDQISELPGGQKDGRSLEELRTTLILAQTSAAIQILLESCLPGEEEGICLNKRESNLDLDSHEKLILEKFNASVECICEHLHQVFIADTNLAKLVHFQTYSSDLLATTSDKIPSMHICLDFIPELLSQPDISKQVFVIELTSHLCEKYAITKSLNVAKLCFNVAYTLLQLLPSDRRALFFIPVLPALMRICNVFPILREDADLILTQIEQITLAHIASTSSRLSLNSTKPFQGVESMSWQDVKKLMRTLDLHEALYLCIQKVIICCQK